MRSRLAFSGCATNGADQSIFYYGGGGQGNHLVGAYGNCTRRALGSMFRSNALAQEKTGEFWVDHMLFGTGLSGSFPYAEVAVFRRQRIHGNHMASSAHVRCCTISPPLRTAR